MSAYQVTLRKATDSEHAPVLTFQLQRDSDTRTVRYQVEGERLPLQDELGRMFLPTSLDIRYVRYSIHSVQETSFRHGWRVWRVEVSGPLVHGVHEEYASYVRDPEVGLQADTPRWVRACVEAHMPYEPAPVDLRKRVPLTNADPAIADDDDYDDDICPCGASLDDGQGFDGYCGNCADRLESEGFWS